MNDPVAEGGVTSVLPGFNPDATGRGPRHRGRWYEIVCTDGEVIVARWMGGDFRARRRGDHILRFRDEAFEYDIPYAEILSCLPMHPRYRTEEIRYRSERDEVRRRARRLRRIEREENQR